ncbi:competence type IV pilus minor pilin ComGD [Niallia sp. Krafla_26]|uniref:competence type IV pilus minor pilin ComGD n=1 Tax=Niallia sp. Krafla_26 TaxID=3064703 RepID=UPI003D16E354
MKNNQFGFTLIETLIVLSVFLLIASLSLFFLKPHYDFIEKERFVSLFTSDILYAQQYAISTQKGLYVFIEPNQRMYYVEEKYSQNYVVKRELPASIKLERGSLGVRTINFEILPDGGVTDFGTFFFIIGKKRYKVVFQIGAGRFYVTRE